MTGCVTVDVHELQAMVWLSRRDFKGDVTGKAGIGKLGADIHVNGPLGMGKTAKIFAPHENVYKGSSY